MSYPLLNTLSGNTTAVAQATRMLQRGLPQSLLITGACRLSLEEFAKGFAGSILTKQDPHHRHLDKLTSGHHPDLYLLRPEGKGNQYTIETIRQFIDLLPLPPTEAVHKVFILFDAERMLPVAANALLKSIEEPSYNAVIMLVSKTPELLLPTLVSRCQTLNLRALPDSEIAAWLVKIMGMEPLLAQSCARLAEGSKERAQLLSQDAAIYRKTLLPLLQELYTGQATYTRRHEATESLVKTLQSHVKRKEDARGAGKDAMQELSPQQRHAQEKQEDGESAQYLREAFALLCVHLLAYVRDGHAVEAGVSDQQRYYPDVKAHSQGIAFEHVEARVQRASSLLDRFTPLKTCIEALFLADESSRQARILRL